MRNNETGEFELVVGDRQLLSAFFIVVLLCAVAFAMGYVVGQNAPRSGKATADNAAAPQAANAAESRPQPLAPAPNTAPPPAAAPGDNAAAPADNTPQPTTQAAQAAAPGGEAQAQQTPQQPAAQTAASAAPPAAASSAPMSADDLPEGSYWQVMAVADQQAQMLRTTLKDHGFSVYLTPGSKGLIRVLVGPYADAKTMGKAKTDLENAGMHPLRYRP